VSIQDRDVGPLPFPGIGGSVQVVRVVDGVTRSSGGDTVIGGARSRPLYGPHDGLVEVGLVVTAVDTSEIDHHDGRW